MSLRVLACCCWLQRAQNAFGQYHKTVKTAKAHFMAWKFFLAGMKFSSNSQQQMNLAPEAVSRLYASTAAPKSGTLLSSNYGSWLCLNCKSFLTD